MPFGLRPDEHGEERGGDEAPSRTRRRRVAGRRAGPLLTAAHRERRHLRARERERGHRSDRLAERVGADGVQTGRERERGADGGERRRRESERPEAPLVEQHHRRAARRCRSRRGARSCRGSGPRCSRTARRAGSRSRAGPTADSSPATTSSRIRLPVTVALGEHRPGAGRAPSAGPLNRGCRRTYVRVEQEGELRRAARPQRLLVPRRGLAAGGAGGAGGGARLPGDRAHRPRRRLRLARVRARGEGARRPGDHRRGADPRRRLARHAARRDAAGVREPLPAPHRGSLPDAAEGGTGAAAAVARPGAVRGAARGARLPLRLRAARPRRPRSERGCPARRSLRTGPLLRRAPAAVRARRRAAQRCAPRARCDAARADGRDRRRPRARHPPCGAPGRARRDPLPHLARRLRARAARQPRVRARRARRHARALPGRPGRGRAHRRARRAAGVRPDGGARLPLSRLLRRRRAGDRPAPARLRARVRRALLRAERTQATRTRAPRGGARADRRARARRLLPAPLGGARARARGRVRGARARLDAARAPARPRPRLLRRLARLLPDRAVARRPGRGEPLARTLPQPRAVVGARHRPRLPARHPRAADRPRDGEATAASTRRSSRPSRRTARAARSATSARRSACRSRISSGWRSSRTAGTRRASRRRRRCCRATRRSCARRAGAPSRSCAPRSPVCRATSHSTRAGW